MSRSKSLPRYENPASVEVGDTIRVAWSAGGVEHTRTGRVHRIIEEGPVLLFVTREGHEIFHWMVAGTWQPKVTLLAVEQTFEHLELPLDDLEGRLAA